MVPDTYLITFPLQLTVVFVYFLFFITLLFFRWHFSLLLQPTQLSLTSCQSLLFLVWHSNIARHSSRQHANLFSTISCVAERGKVNSKCLQYFYFPELFAIVCNNNCCFVLLPVFFYVFFFFFLTYSVVCAALVFLSLLMFTSKAFNVTAHLH